MLRFYAHRLFAMTRTLDYMRSFVEQQGNVTMPLSEEANREIASDVDKLCNMLTEMGLLLSLDSAKRIKLHVLKTAAIDDAFSNLVEELAGRIRDELHKRIFFMIPLPREQFYNPENSIMGKGIIDKFPKLAYDIAEAGNCYALGRYTSCVFHLMRVMESLVQKLGSRLKITINPKDETWFQIIVHVNKAIDKFPDKDTRQRERKARHKAISASLDAVRIAWRNKVMHPKETYTEEEALNLIHTVRIFISALLEIL